MAFQGFTSRQSGWIQVRMALRLRPTGSVHLAFEGSRRRYWLRLVVCRKSMYTRSDRLWLEDMLSRTLDTTAQHGIAFLEEYSELSFYNQLYYLAVTGIPGEVQSKEDLASNGVR